ncbi:MAG TPA: hypothetical protein VMK65_13085 [Longimicrobiales bacterium]|nr:hypothetical protein [Longimicrobiales bacterium]
MTHPRLLALAACGLMAGCTGDNIGGVQVGGADGRDEVATGTFEAQVSGLVTTTLGGSARFGTVLDPETGIAVWVLNLAPASGSVAGVHFVRRGPRPTTDVTLGEIRAGGELPGAEVGGVFVAAEGVRIQAGFFSTTGALDITQSTVDAMAGSFEFDARGYVVRPDGSVQQGEVRVRGTYDALPGTVFIPPTR